MPKYLLIVDYRPGVSDAPMQSRAPPEITAQPDTVRRVMGAPFPSEL